MCIITILATVTRTSQFFITGAEVPEEIGSALFYGTRIHTEPEITHVTATSISFGI